MNVIVIGDIMIDINNTSEIKRRAPEADIPIHNVLDVHYILGGAANVAQNLNNLGVNVELVSVIGDDIYGIKIKELLDSNDIYYNLFIDKERNTTQKNRIFVDKKLDVRFDIETTSNISKYIEKEAIDYILGKKNIDAIVISDYDKGFITEYLSQSIISFANENNIPTFVDPKINNYMKYKNCFLFKPNENEAKIISNEIKLDKILDFIKNKLQCKNILLTMGEKGMILNNVSNKIQHNNSIHLVDVTGAGDIVLAVLVFIYIKSKNLLEASKIANYIGGKSISVVGNYNVSISDIRAYFETNNQINSENKIIYDHEIDKICNISNNNNIVFTNGCFDILHSAHIELLIFSKNQGDILVVGLNSDDSIKRLKGESRPINDIYERSKILSLFNFIDYVIIFNDDTPLNIIKLLKPNILIKGSDYNKENIIGKEYVNEVILFNYVNNKSSTNVINKIKNI